MSDNGKKKIVVYYSTGGLGHKKAALALYEAFKNRGKDIDVELIDALDYGNKFLRFVCVDMYVYMMTKGKWLWAILYHVSNNPIVDALTRWLREKTDALTLRVLIKDLFKRNPDAIVSTHFLLPIMANILKKNKSFKSKLYTLMTDYGPHVYWFSKGIDKYFVGSNYSAEETGKCGISQEKINVTGIPTEGDFGKLSEIPALKGKYGLNPEKKTIFLMSGGFGVGPLERMLKGLNECKAEFQVIAVCGHNEKLYQEIDKLKQGFKYRLLPIGFTDKVAELMAVSDLMITKAGGISVTEAMNSHLPMILYSSIPGQESWNERFLVLNGAAEKAHNIKEITDLANKILLSRDVYESLKHGIEKVRRPNAANDVVKDVFNDLGVE